MTLEQWLHVVFAMIFISKNKTWILRMMEFLIVFGAAWVSIGIQYFDSQLYSLLSITVLAYVFTYHQEEARKRKQDRKERVAQEDLWNYEQMINILAPQGVAVVNKNLDQVLFLSKSLCSRFCNDKLQLLKTLQETLNGNPGRTFSLDRDSTGIPRFDDALETKRRHFKHCSEVDAKISEVRSMSINWQHEPALMIFFSGSSSSSLPSTFEELEEQREGMDVIASVSHELRAPTNSIMSALEIASTKNADPETQNLIKIARNSANFLLNIINSFLDMGQLHAHKISLNLTNQNLFSLLKEIKEMMELQTRSKRIEFILEIPEGLSTSICTDGDRLKQILINLISNAIKFTTRGSITLGIRWEEKPEILEFYVRDTGIGIKEEDQIKLFRPYGKLDHDRSKGLNKQGVGLGLVISSELAVLLGPANSEGIQVESVYQQGSKFSFKVLNQNHKRMPLGSRTQSLTEADGIELGEGKIIEKKLEYYSQKEFKTMKNHSSNFTERKGLAGLTILVVDDNPFNLLAIKNVLEHLSINVIEAYNGQEALEKVKESFLSGRKIHLVFMDCYMPVMDGFEATSQIKKLIIHQGQTKLPIIGLTGDVRASSKKQCLESGMDDILEKPISKATIVSTISRML